MNKTIFIAAMLAIATVLAAGLTVLPSSVQEAQANPCATEVEIETDQRAEDTGENVFASAAESAIATEGDERECNFIGPVELDED